MSALFSSAEELVAWYGNEWPYTRQVVEPLLHMQAIDHGVMREGLV